MDQDPIIQSMHNPKPEGTTPPPPPKPPVKQEAKKSFSFQKDEDPQSKEVKDNSSEPSFSIPKSSTPPPIKPQEASKKKPEKSSESKILPVINTILLLLVLITSAVAIAMIGQNGTKVNTAIQNGKTDVQNQMSTMEGKLDITIQKFQEEDRINTKWQSDLFDAGSKLQAAGDELVKEAKALTDDANFIKTIGEELKRTDLIERANKMIERANILQTQGMSYIENGKTAQDESTLPHSVK